MLYIIIYNAVYVALQPWNCLHSLVRQAADIKLSEDYLKPISSMIDFL